MFDSIIKETAGRFNLGDKAGALVSALLALMTNSEDGGFAGFLNRFRKAGLGDLADSWVSSGANTPVSNEQLESALGEDTLRGISEQVGVDYGTTTPAAAYLVPHLVDDLTPNGEIPAEGDLLSGIGGYLTGAGATGAVGDTFDRVDASVSSTVRDETKPAELADKDESVLGVPGIFAADDDQQTDTILDWLLPLVILVILVILGFWFCGGKSEPVAAPETNVNTNKAVNGTPSS